MESIKLRILSAIVLATLVALITSTKALAEGVGSFNAGSIIFFNGTSFSEDNSNLFWDDTNNRLGIGTAQPTFALDVTGDVKIGQGTSSNLYVRNVNALPGNFLELHGEDGAAGTNGSGIDIYGGKGGSGNTSGGWITFRPGVNQGSGVVGKIGFQNTNHGFGSFAFLDLSSLSSADKTFTFPNTSGTFGLLETNQTWSGLNKFEASTNSTIYVGSSVKSGCIAMGDSDGSGVTYVTANDGVLTASTTKPSVCQ